MITKEYAYTPISTQNLTLSGSSQTLTVPSGCTAFLIHFEAQSARWTIDGTTPTASVGMLSEAGTKMFLAIPPVNFKLIQVTAGAAVSVTYMM